MRLNPHLACEALRLARMSREVKSRWGHTGIGGYALWFHPVHVRRSFAQNRA